MQSEFFSEQIKVVIDKAFFSIQKESSGISIAFAKLRSLKLGFITCRNCFKAFWNERSGSRGRYMTKVYLIPNAVSEVPDSNPFAKDVTTRVFPVFSMFLREGTFWVSTPGDFLYQSG